MMIIDLAEVEKDNCNCPVHDGDNDNNLANEHLIKRQRSVRRKQKGVWLSSRLPRLPTVQMSDSEYDEQGEGVMLTVMKMVVKMVDGYI